MRTTIIAIVALIVGAVVGIYLLAPWTQPGSQVSAQAPVEQAAPPSAGADSLGAPVRWKISSAYIIRQIAAEISSATRYYDRFIQVLPHHTDQGELLDRIDCPHKEMIPQPGEIPDLSEERERRSAVLLYATFNYDFDTQRILVELKPKFSRTTRVLAICYNRYLRWIFLLDGRVPM